jgi:hypothetical protein
MQMGVRGFANVKGTRVLKHTAHQLMFRHLRTEVYTDTMFSKIISLRQNTFAQVYVTRFYWTKVYPLKKKSEAYLSLDQLHRDIGVFKTIIPDNAMELTDGQFRAKAVHAGSIIRPIEAYTHNQNLGKSGIMELRRMYRKAMIATNSPHILWDYCLQLMAEIRLHSVLDVLDLDSDTPTTRITGDTADIYHHCEFSWYDHVWYIDQMDPIQNKKLARSQP